MKYESKKSLTKQDVEDNSISSNEYEKQEDNENDYDDAYSNQNSTEVNNFQGSRK